MHFITIALSSYKLEQDKVNISHMCESSYLHHVLNNNLLGVKTNIVENCMYVHRQTSSESGICLKKFLNNF